MIAPSTSPPHGMLLRLSSIVQISPAYLDFPLFYLNKPAAPPSTNLACALLPFSPIFSYLPRPSSSATHIHSLTKPKPLPAVLQLS